MRKLLFGIALLFMALLTLAPSVKAQEGHTISFVIPEILRDLPIAYYTKDDGKPETIVPNVTKIPTGNALLIIVPIPIGKNIQYVTFNGEQLTDIGGGVFNATMPDTDSRIVVCFNLDHNPELAVVVKAESKGDGEVFACDVTTDGGEPKLSDPLTLRPLPMAVTRGDWYGLIALPKAGNELVKVTRVITSPDGENIDKFKPADLEAVKDQANKVIGYANKFGFEDNGKESECRYKVVFKKTGDPDPVVKNVITLDAPDANVEIKNGSDVVKPGETQVEDDTKLIISAKAKAAGYVVDKVIFNDAELKLKGNVYEAFMPEKEATLKVTVKENNTFVITLQGDGADVTVMAGTTAVELGKTAVAKDTDLSITVKAKAGQEIVKVLFDGKEQELKNDAFTAKMPAKDVVLEVQTRPTAVEDAYFANVKVNPNPFAEQLRIQNAELQSATYALLNAQGVLLQSGALVYGETVLDTNDLTAGLYLVRVTANGMSKTYSVIKK